MLFHPPFPVWSISLPSMMSVPSNDRMCRLQHHDSKVKVTVSDERSMDVFLVWTIILINLPQLTVIESIVIVTVNTIFECLILLIHLLKSNLIQFLQNFECNLLFIQCWVPYSIFMNLTFSR